MNTARNWQHWKGLVPLEASAILRDAISRYDSTNWRITWRLHQCNNDLLCVCHDLLA